MKSLYAKGKGKIHPSPSCQGQGTPPGGDAGGDALAVLTLLPAAILALTAALRAEDREVLAYLVTRSLQGPAEEKRRCWRLGSHRPMLSCGCFECYTSYWVRWDSSPDRELIHQAIEAFEEHLASSERRPPGGKGGGGRRRDRKEKLKAVPEEKGKGKAKPGKEKKKKKQAALPGDGAGTGDEGPSAAALVSSSCMEEEAEKVYYAEVVVLDDEVGSCSGGGGDGEQAETGMEMVAVQGGDKRRGWADVMGLFNCRFWSLWSPGV